MTPIQALRAITRSEGWFGRILPLALVQLLPIVGQLILIGYGLDSVRAIYAGQTALPPIRWLRAFGDGARLTVAGLIYLAPILAVVPTILSIGTIGTTGGAGSVGVGGFGLVISIGVAVIILPVVRRLRNGGKGAKALATLLASITPILMVGSIILTLTAPRPETSAIGGSLNTVGVVLFVLLAALMFVIFIGLCVGGARYAIEGRGLFQPTTNVKLMWKNRAATGSLILNVILLLVIMFVATGVGLVLLVLPGLVAVVIGSLALWQLVARYSITIGIKRADHPPEKPEKRTVDSVHGTIRTIPS